MLPPRARQAASSTIAIQKNLESFAVTMRTLCTTPGYEHSLCGPGVRMSCYPLPLEEPSLDFVRGRGRQVKVLGRKFILPTVLKLVQADERCPSRIFAEVRPGYWLVTKFLPLQPVPMADFLMASQAIRARTEADVVAAWRSGELVIDEGDQTRSSLLACERHYFHHALAKCRDPDTDRTGCSCEVMGDESLCPPMR